MAGQAAAFATVAGEVALVRTVRALLGGAPAPGVVVVAAETTRRDRPLLPGLGGVVGVPVLAAGAPGTRPQCLSAAIEWLGREPHPARHVLIHDVGHPLASTGATDRVIAGLRAGHPVVVPVLPVTDTFKAVSDGGAVMVTVDRTELLTSSIPAATSA